MKVTNTIVFIFKGQEDSKLKGTARVVLDDELQLTGLRIYQGSKDLFVSYPNDPYYKGEDYRQLFFPTTCELRTHIEEEVIKVYKEQLKIFN